MTTNDEKFLVSVGDSDQEYGLYVMERESVHHAKNAWLAYYYDSDSFFHLNESDKGLFIPTSELISCKDEFGNEYKGKQLLVRVKDAIKAYKEELPGYVENVLNHPADFDFDD